MEFIIGLIKIIMWWMIIDIAVGAGKLHNPFLLLLSIVLMTYWYWRYPVFKKDKTQNGEG